MKKIILLLFVLISMGLHAQTPYFQTYRLMKKNENVQVNIIFQSRTGFIYFGTNKGLFVFDGLNEKRFTLKDSLADENVTALAEDSLGRMWIGYKNGKISYQDKGKIKPFEPQEGTPVQPISDIIFDK